VGQNDLAGLARQINEEHDHFKAALPNNLGHARKAGELLPRAKAQLGHGKWLRWLTANCRVPERTAQVYMRLGRALGVDCTAFADCSDVDGPQPPARAPGRNRRKE
jgi:hypothetical protein